jgi:hypothetical protein
MAAKKKAAATPPKKVTEAKPATSQARLELPRADMERVRAAAKSRGLSLVGFVRLAVLEKAARIAEGRD